MSDTANEGTSTEADKPAAESNEVKFPPFPEPTDKDFEDDVSEEDRSYFKKKFPDLNAVKYMRLHCTACDRHLGSSARNITRMRAHPMLRTLVCHTCHTFYNSGEFEKGDDGSELYCRWCGQGGQVYCCSDCPHVFCAKCIKRNMGISKIKDIENADDWKCFKCNSESLKDLRANCWALLRYCDLKNEMTYKTEDTKLREVFQKECAQDYTECCKSKNRKREKPEVQKKKEEKKDNDKSTTTIISKIPSTIQVKKFASINIEDQNMVNTPKIDKKPAKRPASPKQKAILIKNPMSIANVPRLLNPTIYSPPMKKIKMTNNVVNTAIRFTSDNRFTSTYTRIRPKAHAPPVSSATIINNFNGFNNSRVFSNIQNMVVNDNINLSLESLTQGLDMATVAAMSTQNNITQNDDVVCTPDFPIEPLCEVTEDNDDDVQCITPDPVQLFKITNPPPLVPRGSSTLAELSSDNIIQMTENDVTVNSSTGGLKFRVDPQTLSSNKMYRLPDGRVFAINPNPNMPGGYSATIVAVTEPAVKSLGSQGATYAAKLSAIPNPNASTPQNQKPARETRSSSNSKRNTAPKRKTSQRSSISRECDLNVPVEWYRYNLIDAVDALEFSLTRLNKLKKEATTMFLRTRTVTEMRTLHKTLDRLLNTSSKRFLEIKDSLNKEMKQYVVRKMGGHVSDDDDDDVEILPDLENEDPIFIDENSVDSNEHENQEIDLTGLNSSELNDSGEKDASISRIESDPLSTSDNYNATNSDNYHALLNEPATIVSKVSGDKEKEGMPELSLDKQNNLAQNENNKIHDSNKELICNESLDNIDTDDMNHISKDENAEKNDCEKEHKNDENVDVNKKVQDSVMSDEAVESLLKDDSDGDNTSKINSIDVAELQET